jgi:hypothetical protein
MKLLSKKIFVFFLTLSLLSSGVVAMAAPRYFKQLKLQYSTDMVNWEHVPGNQVSGLKLKLDPGVEYYYVDVMSIRNFKPRTEEIPFYLEYEDLPDEFWAYWEGKGVDEYASGGFQEIMYDIITGELPMCILTADDRLLDGLVLEYTGEEVSMRINGEYPLGDYTLRGEVTAEHYEYITITLKSYQID